MLLAVGREMSAQVAGFCAGVDSISIFAGLPFLELAHKGSSNRCGFDQAAIALERSSCLVAN